MYKSANYFLICIILLTIACSDTRNKPLITTFNTDSSAIVLKNINPAGLLQLKNTWKTKPDSLQLLSVLIVPAANDSLQTEKQISGKTFLRGDSILFIPDSPFVKGKTYLIETYINTRFYSTEKALKGELNYYLRPQQQTLTR